jgi:allantoinase
MTDLVIRDAAVVLPSVVEVLDIAVENGTIVDLGRGVGTGTEEIDAAGLTVLPGTIDVHVHFNEPGRTDWEGAATGSRALAAGGGTTFFDMPLNSTPCTVDVGAFDRKRDALAAASIADFGLWGGLVPGSVEEMAALADRGVVGFKAFMCDSGLPEFPRADDVTLLGGMREAARLDLPVAVHAESEELTKGLHAHLRGTDFRDFLEARPVIAELDAIQRALLFAGETGVRLHIVHVSSGRGVVLAAEARAHGVNVTIETCPHYLSFTDEDLERLGVTAKCAPPFRDVHEQQLLWRTLVAGHVDIVGSDHSPAQPSMKRGDFLRAWGGIAGVQSTLAVLLEGGHHERGLPLTRIASLLAGKPAERFRLGRKGRVATGHDADLVLVDLNQPFVLRAEDLQQRHPMSPYIGMTFHGNVRRTIRRGETVFLDGAVQPAKPGQLVVPAR